MLIKLLPFLIAVGYGLLLWYFSARSLRAELDRRSTPLTDPTLTRVIDRLAQALDLPTLKVYVY